MTSICLTGPNHQREKREKAAAEALAKYVIFPPQRNASHRKPLPPPLPLFHGDLHDSIMFSPSGWPKEPLPAGPERGAERGLRPVHPRLLRARAEAEGRMGKEDI